MYLPTGTRVFLLGNANMLAILNSNKTHYNLDTILGIPLILQADVERFEKIVPCIIFVENIMHYLF